MQSDLKIVPVYYVLTPTDSRVRQIESRILQMASNKYLRMCQTELALLMFCLQVQHVVFENQILEQFQLT